MASRTSTKQIRSTRDYRLFRRDSDNRVLDLKKHRKLQKSMEQYGFLQSFPIVVHRNGSKTLSVKDGQHRLAFAEMLGLPVYFVEEEVDFDVAAMNGTAKVWVTKDYALKYAADGLADYQEGLEFSEKFRIPIGKAFAMLGGTTSFNNVQDAFCGGTFKIKDRDWANSVAIVYTQMCVLSKDLKNAAFLSACMSVCRVPDFDAGRLLQCAARCRERLVSYSTRDAYLGMLEEVYNFGRKQLFGLKSAAVMAMRDRFPIRE